MVPEKIAVLGGGMSALTAAFELARLRNPDHSPRYDITVYQMGWRLGGKGASGRNTEHEMRIEEHGLHIWFGAYANAFRTMQAVYSQCPDKWPCAPVKAAHPAHPEEWPWRSIEVAFRRQKDVYVMEERSCGWLPWHFEFPKSGAVPGTGAGSVPGRSSIDLVRGVQTWLGDHFANSLMFRHLKPGLAPLDLFVSIIPDNAILTPQFLRNLASIGNLENLGDAQRRELAKRYERFAHSLARWVRWAIATADVTLLHIPGFPSVQSAIDDIRRFWELFDLGQAVVRGALLDGVVAANDWDVINEHDWRTWLGRWLVDPATLNSATVTANYDLFFSYPRGNTDTGSFEAGTASRAALWILLTYEGSIMWRMNAGMGDAIFAPVYNALKALGVKFKFFHKVTSLGLSADSRDIATITVEKQATVARGPEDYAPFVAAPPDGADCWPHRPLFDQLVERDALRANWDEHNLESDWSAWRGGSGITLSAGQDFDKIVLGIPVGALPDICREIIARPESGRFRQMLAVVQTIETCAAQLWLDTDLPGLRTPLVGDPPVLSTFVNPLDTYADMTHLIRCETWPASPPPPRHCAYFCGVLADENSIVPPRHDTRFPTRAAGMVKDLTLEMLRKAMPVLWPGAFTRPGSQFEWNLLRSAHGVDAKRFDDQYFRANVDASERYVLAVPGTSRHRLKADESGCRNLFLAGDWTANGLYVGCIEGAVISGMQAARALSGQPLDIAGEGLLFRRGL